jgi:hypothetical protein
LYRTGSGQYSNGGKKNFSPPHRAQPISCPTLSAGPCQNPVITLNPKGTTIMLQHPNEADPVMPESACEDAQGFRDKPGGMSRRRFLRTAAIGAAAASIALTGKGVHVAHAAGEEGEVIMDAMLVNYVCAIEGSPVVNELTFRRSFTNTFKFALASSSSSTITLSTSSTTNTPAGQASSGTESSFTQEVSSQVAGAISLKTTSSVTLRSRVITAPDGVTPVAAGTRSTPAGTALFGLLRPKMKFVKAGANFNLNYKFLDYNGSGTFNTTPHELAAGAYSTLISPSTQASMKALYPPLQDPSGGTLVKPRFKKKGQYSTSAPASSPETRTRELTEVTQFASSITVTFTGEIKESSGFTSTDPITRDTLQTSFAVGQKFSISLTGAQETASERIMTLTLNLASDRSPLERVWQVYKDKVFKNYILVPISAPATARIQGRVTDAFGNGIGGASVVATAPDGFQYIGGTDGNGNYNLPLVGTVASGSYSVASCAQSAYLYVGGGGTYSAYVSGGDPGWRNPPIGDSPLLD